MFSRSESRSRHEALEQEDDWIEPKREGRDWKKVFLVFGLGTLSWVATYVGILELIRANMGDLDFLTKIVIGCSVAMLMTMIIWLLDQMFAPHPIAIKLSYVAGYLFLTLISVGFGFGFYWKVLESRSEASRSAESAVAQVQAALVAGAARLDQLQGTLEQLTRISQEKAVVERESGASCPNSRPGDGPRRRLRDADAQRFSFASEFVKGRSAKVKGDMQALDVDLKKITSSDASTFDKATGTRNKFLQALSRKLELTATNFNAFRTDPQLRQIRSELADRANRSTFPTGSGNGTFSCPDPQLQSALFGVVKAIDQLPELSKPEIATVEGAQAVVEAFRRLTATLQGALVLKLPPSADEIRELQKQAVRSVEPGRAGLRRGAGSGLSQGGLSQRDYIPLAIAVFVDLCLLLVSIGRPMNRLSGLVPKMREAERGPVYQILSKFDDIHRDAQIREKFEVFRHVVFDFNGDYYVAVPLDAPRNRNPDEVKSLQLEAHLLGNLFASFEKEKIFSRVYNPLLSRKTIQKKLYRQGSKFAASQAFRIYRFRNGAWSDIILGAVMGAAKRAQRDRIRRAQAAGPQLDLPAETVVAQADVGASRGRDDASAKARAEEIIRVTVGEPSPDAADQSDRAFGVTAMEAEEAEAAQRVAAQFRPFADAAGDADLPESLRQRRRGKREWPYRKAPEEAGEAHVELLPANSNTSPRRFASHDLEADQVLEENVGAGDEVAAHGDGPPDNVIVMPLQSPQGLRHGASDEDHDAPRAARRQSPYGADGEHHALAEPPVPARYTDALAHAIALPPHEVVLDDDAIPRVSAVEVDGHGGAPAGACGERRRDGDREGTISMGRGDMKPAGTRTSLEARMNVRITQRTADFQIPLTAMSEGQPIAFLKRGARMTFAAQDGGSLGDEGQLKLDFAGHGMNAPFDAGQIGACEVETVAMEPAAHEAQAGARDEEGAVSDRATVQLSTPGPELNGGRVLNIGDFDPVTDEELYLHKPRRDLPSEADLVEISKRFAPSRNAD